MAEQSDSEEMQTAETEYRCILLCGTTCCASDSLDNITHAKWESIKNKSSQWKELDRIQDVHESVEWEKGPKGLFMYISCYTTMSSKQSLSQAQKGNRHPKKILTVKACRMNKLLRLKCIQKAPLQYMYSSQQRPVCMVYERGTQNH